MVTSKLVLALLALAVGARAGAGEPGPKPLETLAPLLGTWDAQGGGAPGKGTGTVSFARDAGGHAVVRRNAVTYPAADGRPASTHEDLLVLYAEAGATKGLYVDGEGHVIRYTAEASLPSRLVLASDPGPGPRFRLTHDWSDPASLRIVFEIAPPGSTEFKAYAEGGRRADAAPDGPPGVAPARGTEQRRGAAFRRRYSLRSPEVAMRRLLVGAVAACVSLPCAGAEGGVDRLYVLDCGWARVADESRFTPGANVGVPIDISHNCYLVHHRDGYLLWDTGYPDALASHPEGEHTPDGAFHRFRPRTLASQLAALGVKPSDVRFVALSHTHPDHVGNVDLFPDAPVLIERAEYDWAFAQKTKPFSPEHRVVKLDGDDDVFHDGSVVVLSTPGHTPGHASLAVHLPKTGWVILSGDAVHLRTSWDHRLVPNGSFDKEKTAASIQRLSDELARRHAQLWINHDKAQSDGLRHAPAFYE